MFVSKPHAGTIYSAERSDRGPKLRWSATPIVNGCTVRIDADDVPRSIRAAAYKLFEGDRVRQKRERVIDWAALIAAVRKVT